MKMKRKLDKEFINTMSKDPGNWRGPFYFNRRDPRIIVPKLHQSLGWTLNFARPASYIGMAAIIVVIILLEIYFR
jgi:uncharacterized membrane protein